MERQTLQQEAPVYHVCQTCGGEGCAACSDLCILEGEIELDPELDDELPSVTPINGVIGIKSKPRFFGLGAIDDRSLAQIAHDDMVMRGDFEV
ncbi:hypothetical protein ACSZN8_02240 [Aeromonas caviae]|uniref:hypothetical protein n=1 Tax=Aeromonas caviae TaxID=648 RepID=UPI003EC720B5